MWARIDNGVVAELTEIDPQGRFHSSLHWVMCDDAVQPGWLYQDEIFKEFDSQPAPAALYPRFYGNQKLDLFTQSEQLTVVAATMTDPVVKLMYDRLLGAAYWTYEDAETETGLSLLVEKGLLSPERKAAIIVQMGGQQTD